MLFANSKYIYMTLLTWTIWFAVAITYYGIVLLNTEIFLLEDGGEFCPEIYYPDEDERAVTAVPIFANGTYVINATNSECQQLESDDYFDAFLDSVAEFPGIILIFILIETVGRKPTLASGFFFVGLMFFILCFCMSRGLQTLVLFLARGIIAGVFQAAYLLTSEVKSRTFVSCTRRDCFYALAGLGKHAA